MEMLCPDCMGPLAVRISMARCTLHGGTYRILFQRPHLQTAPVSQALSAGVAPPAPAPRGREHCARHPDAESMLTCARCQSAICQTCAFPQEDGMPLCPDCATGRPLGLAMPRMTITPGTMCRNHPESPAVERCATCRTPVCATCDFAFPGNLHLCTECATNPSEAVSPKRKKSALWSYGLAALGSLGFVLAMVVAAVSKSQEISGVVFMLFGFLPSIVGVGLGLGAIERRLGNPLWVWVPVVWNGLLLGVLLLLSIVGTLMR